LNPREQLEIGREAPGGSGVLPERPNLLPGSHKRDQAVAHKAAFDGVIACSDGRSVKARQCVAQRLVLGTHADK